MTKKRKQLLAYTDGKPSSVQHKKPCSDCPFARTALPGWLAGYTPLQWLELMRWETKMECHVHIGPECAGAAIYRSNSCQRPRDKSLLVLPKDTRRVFANSMEFLKHHERRPNE